MYTSAVGILNNLAQVLLILLMNIIDIFSFTILSVIIVLLITVKLLMLAATLFSVFASRSI